MSIRALFLASALASCIFAAPGALRAQPPDSLVLTLEDAVRIAERSNPGYRQAANSMGLNATEMRTTWATQVLPSARLTLFDTEYTGNLQNVARDVFGNPIENPESEWVYFSNTRQSLGLSWNIQGASIFNSLGRQKRTNLDRELAVDRSWIELQSSVRRQFYEVPQQRDLLETERRLAEARAVEQEIADRLFRLARTNRVDILNAELAVQQQALAVQRQRASYEQAKLTLRTRLGDPALPPIRLAEEPLPVFDPASLDAEVLTARAEEVNPRVRQAASAVASASLGVKESTATRWPDLSFGLNFYRRAQAREQSALFDFSFDESLESNFYVALSLPFFNSYFQNDQAIERSRVELDNQREGLREARLQVEEQVRTALLNLRNQHETLRLAARSAEIAEEALELARQEYRIGTRTFEQLRDSMEQEATMRRQVIEARYGFVDALLTLEEAVGAPVGGAAPATTGAGS